MTTAASNSAGFILGVGSCAIDDIIYIDDPQPADGKVRVTGRLTQVGGNTAAALITAARMGASCKYFASLGDDPASAQVRRELASEQVDVSDVVHDHRARPVLSTIIVSRTGRTRTVYFDDSQPHGALAPVPERVLRAARLMVVDGRGLDGCVPAALQARASGIPVVADIEGGDSNARRLLAVADHVIMPLGLACELAGSMDAAEAVQQLTGARTMVMIATSGAQGCYYMLPGDGEIHHQPAYPVTATDTTGCGDVFVGAYAAALAAGQGPLECIRIATVMAAMAARRDGLRAGLASPSELRPALERLANPIRMVKVS